MAKLSVTDAARVAGVSRITLHRHLKNGHISRTADGRIDTAELIRAGFVLHPETLINETPATPMIHHDTPASVTLPVASESSAVTHALEQMVELLRGQIDDLRLQVRSSEARERHYQERIVWLEAQVDQIQTHFDRLLEAPRQLGSSVLGGAPRVSTATPHGSKPRDPAKYEWGPLCPRGHDPEGRGQSQLRIYDGQCADCRVEAKREYRQRKMEARQAQA